MALNVTTAFAEFLTNSVNLNPKTTKKARSSRNWLFDQIRLFQSDETFPKSYSEKDISFGSFSRRTKKRPLDDIDLMICLHAQGAYYTEFSDRIEITINPDYPDSNLRPFRNENTYKLNSIKVINKFIKKFADVPQYSKADLKRNGSAAVLSLRSYDWCFDVVPCFITAPDAFGGTFYFIPDGNGYWKKTDPRIDRDRTMEINQKHDGNILNVIRIIKYWNKRPTMPSMSSYLLETMILDYYQHYSHTADQFVDLEIPKVLEYVSTNVYNQVQDPKNIQGNINNISREDQNKISAKANYDKQKATDALDLESINNHEGSIQKWGEIFGGEFQNYE